MINARLSVLPGADMIEMSEGRGKMFGGGVTKLLRYGGDALLRVGEESGRRGHAGLCFFLQKGFSLLLSFLSII